MAPISGLPSEILRMIFLYFRPSIDPSETLWRAMPRSVKPLTHELAASMGVCRQWRSVIIDNSSLWTQLVCRPPANCDHAALSTYLSLLDVFIRRSGSAPLNVFLYIHGLDFGIQVELWAFIMENAPFRRWRLLELDCRSLGPLSIDFSGDFTALESLTCSGDSYHTYPLLQYISRSAKHLRQANFPWGTNKHVLKAYPFINHITTLLYKRIAFSLPPNITRLYCLDIPAVSLPHIHELTIGYLDFALLDPSFFPRLEKLEVKQRIWARRSDRIAKFPSLRHLAIGSDEMHTLGLLNCPSLETLSIKRHPSHLALQDSSDIAELLKTRRYQLSPTTLDLNLHLPSDVLLSILSASSRVEDLQVLSEGKPLEWLSDALTEKLDSQSKGIKLPSLTWKFCPALTTLRIKVTQSQTNANEWQEYLLRILNDRVESPLKVATCVWEDGNEITVTV